MLILHEYTRAWSLIWLCAPTQWIWNETIEMLMIEVQQFSYSEVQVSGKLKLLHKIGFNNVLCNQSLLQVQSPWMSPDAVVSVRGFTLTTAFRCSSSLSSVTEKAWLDWHPGSFYFTSTMEALWMFGLTRSFCSWVYSVLCCIKTWQHEHDM